MVKQSYILQGGIRNVRKDDDKHQSRFYTGCTLWVDVKTPLACLICLAQFSFAY